MNRKIVQIVTRKLKITLTYAGIATLVLLTIKLLLSKNHMIEIKKKEIDCLRCKVPLVYSGNFKFHEGTRVGVLGNLLKLSPTENPLTYISVRNAEKVEFYTPGI